MDDNVYQLYGLLISALTMIVLEIIRKWAIKGKPNGTSTRRYKGKFPNSDDPRW